MLQLFNSMFCYVLNRAVIGGRSYVVTLPITRTFYCFLPTDSVDMHLLPVDFFEVYFV